MLVLPASRLLQGFAELEEEWTPDYSTDKTWRETRVPAFLAAWRMINRLTFAHAGHVHCWCASACRVWFKRFFRKGACKSSEQGWNQDAAETYMVKAWVCTTLRVCSRFFLLCWWSGTRSTSCFSRLPAQQWNTFAAFCMATIHLIPL